MIRALFITQNRVPMMDTHSIHYNKGPIPYQIGMACFVQGKVSIPAQIPCLKFMSSHSKDPIECVYVTL